MSKTVDDILGKSTFTETGLQNAGEALDYVNDTRDIKDRNKLSGGAFNKLFFKNQMETDPLATTPKQDPNTIDQSTKPKTYFDGFSQDYEPGGFYMDYTNWWLKNQPNPMLTPEEKERLAKKEKRDMMWAKIGAGFDAFNQAYANARGIKPVVDPNVDIVGKTRARYERLNKERQADQERWNQGYMNAVRLDQTAARERRNSEIQARQLDLKEKEEERRVATYNLAVRKQDWLEKRDQGKLDIEKEKLEIERQYRNAQISKYEHDISMNELKTIAQVNKMNRSGSGGGGSRGGSQKNGNVDEEWSYEYNQDGKVSKKTHNKKVAQPAPPSRNALSKTPPSRQ